MELGSFLFNIFMVRLLKNVWSIFGFVGLNLLIDFISYFVTHEIYSSTSSTIMSIIFFIIPSTVLGYTGNYFYKRKAEKI